MFKKLLNIFKPEFVKNGFCKKCGKCCRNIIFSIGTKDITELYEFENLKAEQPRYNHFYISGVDDDGRLLFTCNSLGEDNLCKAYKIRSFYCRFYPQISPNLLRQGHQTLEGCGYYYQKADEK